MYSEKFVVAVKHNGHVLREQGETVVVPFGSEYTLFFKNLNSVRALVRVNIDGKDATKGTSLIVPPNESVELERFLDANQMDRGHKFKFIERTKKIEDGPRGVGVEDGLIRVEFEFEKQPPKVEYETIKRTYVEDYWNNNYPRQWSGPLWTTTSVTYGTNGPEEVLLCTASIKSSAFRNLKGAEDAVTAQAATTNDIGITVPGSISEQKFEVSAWFPTDGQKHVMVLKLLGQVGGTKVEKPVTVKTKTECQTCGTKNKFGTKFCKECGTSLLLV